MTPNTNTGMEEMNYAGFWWRFLAAFIDGLILQAIGCTLGFGVGLFVGIWGTLIGLDEEVINGLATTLGGVLGALAGWLYHALFESSASQATPGKMACGLKVMGSAGNRISFSRASGRYWASWLSAIPCLAGYIMAAFTVRKQALHDKLAGTVVVKGS